MEGGGLPQAACEDVYRARTTPPGRNIAFAATRPGQPPGTAGAGFVALTVPRSLPNVLLDDDEDPSRRRDT